MTAAVVNFTLILVKLVFGAEKTTGKEQIPFVELSRKLSGEDKGK